MPDPQNAPADAVVVFEDTSREYRVALPSNRRSDAEVRAVAYRWACKQIAEGEWNPTAEIRFVRMGRL